MKFPLDGIRIVSLAEQYPGPYATLLLADLGAEVVLVERNQGGDPARQFPDFHAALNRNKKSVTLDIKADAGKAQLRDLVASADVPMEGFRPGTMARLGFGYEAMARSTPVWFTFQFPVSDRPDHTVTGRRMTFPIRR